jgi:medium-chain acyl-[acyl-carrier-protein] hydrolase
MFKQDIDTAWLRVLKASDEARVQLFCFPYAGGAPGVFRGWAAHMPRTVELIGVHYPGREARANERPLTSLEQLVTQLQAVLRHRLELPFAFYGHSMGAYIAYEVARRLDRQDGLRAEHLFLSGASAPHLRQANPIHHLPPREFLIEVLRLNGVPGEVRKSPEMLAYLLPILRADFISCETHSFEAAGPLAFPLTVFGGHDDPRASEQQLAAWSSYAGVRFDLDMVQGDHFFVHTQQARLLAKILCELCHCPS